VVGAAAREERVIDRAAAVPQHPLAHLPEIAPAAAVLPLRLGLRHHQRAIGPAVLAVLRHPLVLQPRVVQLARIGHRLLRRQRDPLHRAAAVTLAVVQPLARAIVRRAARHPQVTWTEEGQGHAQVLLHPPPTAPRAAPSAARVAVPAKDHIAIAVLPAAAVGVAEVAAAVAVAADAEVVEVADEIISSYA